MIVDIKKLKLPALSTAGLQILDMLTPEMADTGRISELIGHDPTLTATLIKYANAPLYRRAVEVRNVRNAVNILGLKNVRLAVVVATMRSFAMPPSTALDLVWEHSFGIAAAARLIAQKCARRHADDIELTALMHDMGALVLASNYPDEYEDIVRSAAKHAGKSMESYERELFGLTHGAVTDYMAEVFRMPNTCTTALKEFHSGKAVQAIMHEADRHVATLGLAHIIDAKVNSETSWLTEEIPASMETLQVALGLSDDHLENIMEDYETLLNEQYAH